MTVSEMEEKIYGGDAKYFMANPDTWFVIRDMFMRIQQAHRLAIEIPQPNPQQTLDVIADILNGTASTH